MIYLDVWVVHDQRWWHLQSQVIVLPPVQHEGDTLLSHHLTQRQIWRQGNITLNADVYSVLGCEKQFVSL